MASKVGSFLASAEAGEEAADVLSQVIHDVALHAESLGEWELCARLYGRALRYRVNTARIRVGNWYRCGFCQERMGRLREAIAAYREALREAEAWPYVAAVTRKRLADLLVAAEEFDAAASTLSELLGALPHPEIAADQVELNLARCQLRLGAVEAARRRLEALCGTSSSAESAAEALRLLADSYEVGGEVDAAASCYQRIIQSGAAEVHLKLAAAHRLSALRRPR